MATVDAAGTFKSLGTFDTYSGSAGRDSLVTALNALGNTVTVMVVTGDEPTTNLDSTLRAALIRCGATDLMLSRMRYRGAYLLVGVPATGPGIERMAGVVVNDPDAWVDYTVDIIGGRPKAATGKDAATVVQANVATEADARAAADSALSSRLDTVSASLSTTSAAVTSEASARATADTALGQRIDTVTTKADAAATAVQTEAKARADGDTALGSRLDTVVASYGADAANMFPNPVPSVDVSGWAGGPVERVSSTDASVPPGAPTLWVFSGVGEITGTVPKAAAAGQMFYFESLVASNTDNQKIGIGARWGYYKDGSLLSLGLISATPTKTWTRISGYVTAPNNTGTAQARVSITNGSAGAPVFFTNFVWRPAEAVSPVQAAVTSEATARAAADSALGTRIDTVTASLTSASAAITAESKARADADSAQATQITGLQAQVDNQRLLRVSSIGSGKSAEYGSGLFDAVTGRIIAGAARSWMLATVDADGVVKAFGAYDVYGTASKRTDFVNDLNALPRGVTTIVWTADEPSSGMNDDIRTALVRHGATSAVLKSIAYRSAYVLVGFPDAGEGGGVEKYSTTGVVYPFAVVRGKPLASGGSAPAVAAMAAVTTETTARAAADSALGTRIDTVSAKTDAAAAAVTSETTARTSADSALGQRVDGVVSRVGTAEAAIQSNASATSTLSGKLAASYSLKTQITADGKRYAAGWALGVEVDAGISQSQFLVMVDRFAVLSPDGKSTAVPFAIESGQMIVNRALIKNLDATNINVANLSS
ncbi:phage tail tip fiber protein, partial [Chitinasiproducens palmae]|uniref:phage tail tip fiber protein n=1 Tax=Chitinasiproducens palmae TaxID=1770053 RepID=UPI00147A9CFF